MPSSSSSHIKFIKASHDFVSSTSNSIETQAFKAKRSHMSNDKGKSRKTQPPLTQRGKAQVRRAQSKHAYMYTRHNTSKHVTQYNVPKYVT